MAQLKDLIVNGNARIITDLNVNGYETVDETVKVGRDPTANLEVATKQYVDNHTVPEELFIVTQNTTTYSEISTAISNGKIPVIVSTDDGNIIGYYQTSLTFSDSPEHTFVTLHDIFGLGMFIWKCSSDTSLGTNGWYTVQYATTTTIDSSSTNYGIPTALAVYNALSSAGGSSLYYDQITLNTSSWSSNTYTATVSGMTSTAIVWVNPTDDSKTYWTRANVRATSQSLDTLVFTCTDQELASYTSLNVNVVWTEPASQS